MLTWKISLLTMFLSNLTFKTLLMKMKKDTLFKKILRIFQRMRNWWRAWKMPFMELLSKYLIQLKNSRPLKIRNLLLILQNWHKHLRMKLKSHNKMFNLSMTSFQLKLLFKDLRTWFQLPDASYLVSSTMFTLLLTRDALPDTKNWLICIMTQQLELPLVNLLQILSKSSLVLNLLPRQ